MRKWCFASAALMAGLMGCGPWPTAARAAVASLASFHRDARFDIAPQALATALIEFSRQANVQIAAPASLLEHRATRGVRGRMPIDVALRRLLSGTPLGFHPVGANTLGIDRIITRGTKPPIGGAETPALRAATAAQSDAAASVAVGPDSSTDLNEVIVTATKRPERAGDVAAALTVFSSDALLNEGYTSFKDFAGLTPGMQVMGSFGSGEPVIRGITSGADTGALVGIVVDGAPIGASSSLTSSGALDALDLDPIDFSNVQILKGPQGTLYGANTLAGIISYTLRKPNLHRANAVLRGGRGATEDGEPSYTVRGAASLPIVTGKFAIRVSAYRDFNGGYIDNATRGIANQNVASHWGAMLSALYRPTDALSIMLTGFFQNFDAVANKVIYNPKTHQPVAGGLAYDAYIYPTSNKQIRVGLLSAHYRMSAATVTSVTSYQRIQTADVLNGTGGGLAAVLSLLPAFGGQPFPAPGALAMGTGGTVRKFTQELRLNSSGAGSWRWLVGGYYSDERDVDQEPMVGRAASGAVLSDLNPAIYFDILSHYREYSGFGDLTYDITPAFSLTGGIRLGHIQQAYSQTFGGSDAAAYNFVLTALGGAATPLQHSARPIEPEHHQLPGHGSLPLHAEHHALRAVFHRVPSGRAERPDQRLAAGFSAGHDQGLRGRPEVRLLAWQRCARSDYVLHAVGRHLGANFRAQRFRTRQRRQCGVVRRRGRPDARADPRADLQSDTRRRSCADHPGRSGRDRCAGRGGSVAVRPALERIVVGQLSGTCLGPLAGGLRCHREI